MIKEKNETPRNLTLSSNDLLYFKKLKAGTIVIKHTNVNKLLVLY